MGTIKFIDHYLHVTYVVQRSLA